MLTKIIEATNGFNWGKFLVARFDHEWRQRSAISDSKTPLLRQLGWDPNFVWVLDLQTGEGALFAVQPSAQARSDLNKHRIWVCPLFEPFLVWLYQQDISDLEVLPGIVQLPEAESAFYGYRRQGQ
jgi:hypothetical protein